MSAEHASDENEQGNLVYLLGLLLGGFILGFGIISLYWSFGAPVGPLNQHLAAIGFSGLDNVGLLGPADYSIGCIVGGALMMVLLNASAWKRTGGY